MTTTKKYDRLNRLLDISSVPSAASAVKFSYAYNDANQRTRRADSDDSYWSYEYDSLGQVTSGKHYWPDALPVAGQQFEYAHDDIGNRRRTKEGGDATGAGLRTAHYTVNNLNQYTQRDVPGAADIIGVAYPYAPVTVNDQSTYRRGEYYHKELAIDNSSAPVWQSVTNQANYTTVTNTAVGNLLLAKTRQTFWYDVDGNTLSDSVWTNSWSAENRVLEAEAVPAIPSAARAKQGWTFDNEGRWIERIVYSWNGSAYAVNYTNRLLWDGKVLVAILDQNNGLLMSFLRGFDFSGSFEQAGGVGGLLAVSIITNGTHFCAYNANGDIAVLVSGSNGEITGAYEYDSFGKLLRISGSPAKTNPLRFSTQFFDEVQGKTKYLYRDSDAGFGRWLSRDTLSELGWQVGISKESSVFPSPSIETLSQRKAIQELSIYQFCFNEPISRYDVLGLDSPGCDGIPGAFEGSCVLECCARHDKCYRDRGCTARSWLSCPLTPCARCNWSAVLCILCCVISGPDHDDPSRPNYYCAVHDVFFDDPASPHMGHSTP